MAIFFREVKDFERFWCAFFTTRHCYKSTSNNGYEITSSPTQNGKKSAFELFTLACFLSKRVSHLFDNVQSLL